MKLDAVSLAGALLLVLGLPPAAIAQDPAPEVQSERPPGNPAEMADFANARKLADPARRAEALEAFVKRYPNSGAKVQALENAVAAHQQAGHAARTLELAKQILEVEPKSVRAMFAYVTQARSMGDQAPEDARDRAMDGILALNSWQKPWDLTQEEYTRMQEEMTASFASSVGYYAMIGRDLGTARMYYQQALQANPMSLEDSYSLGLTELEMQPLDPAGFWYIARAIHLARAAKPGSETFIANYARVKYALFHGDMEGWNDILKRAANETALPDDFTVTQNAAAADQQ